MFPFTAVSFIVGRALPFTEGERAALMFIIACPMLSSLDERQGIETKGILESSPLFPLLFSHPALLTHAHRHPASDQASSYLPRHRQAVGLQCF